MPDLAGDSGRAAVDPATQHQSRADPVGRLYIHKILPAAAGAVAQLTERAQVRVVRDLDRPAEAGGQLAPAVPARPPRPDGRPGAWPGPPGHPAPAGRP